MSIERVSRKNGVVWRVRWRDSDRNRARTFDRKADATAFEAEVRRRKRVEDLASLDAGRETLQEFAEEWWQLHALPNLAPATLANYAHALGRSCAPAPRSDETARPESRGHFPIPRRPDESDVGDASVRKVLAILQGVLQRAVEWRRIPPIRAARSASRRSAANGSFARCRP